MLTFIIGFVIVVGFILLMVAFMNKTYITVISIFMMVLIPMLALEISSRPLYGYEQPVIKETMLLDALDISNVENEDVFLTVASDTFYTYKLKGEEDVNVISENVTKKESVECAEPLLIVYESKAKKGLFSICDDKIIEYEFYVPINTVQEVK